MIVTGLAPVARNRLVAKMLATFFVFLDYLTLAWLFTLISLIIKIFLMEKDLLEIYSKQEEDAAYFIFEEAYEFCTSCYGGYGACWAECCNYACCCQWC